MNEMIEKEKIELDPEIFGNKIKVENMIYEINGEQVMLDSEISATK